MEFAPFGQDVIPPAAGKAKFFIIGLFKDCITIDNGLKIQDSFFD
jgi:hypothetical protein